MTETTVLGKAMCIGCNREIFNHMANGKRVPCPICGSTKRTTHDKVVGHMTNRGSRL